jgi:hypothetical protein
VAEATNAKFRVEQHGVVFLINHVNRRGHWIQGRRLHTLEEIEQLRAAIDVALVKWKGKHGD